MTLKTGVRIQGIKPELLVALMVAESAYKSLGTEMVVTSVVDGKHSRGSRHYQGDAFDLRISNLTGDGPRMVREQIAGQLGNDFDVILEGDHIHVEYDPKEPL